MANAKKCDRCGKYYGAYNGTDTGMNETNGVASVKGTKHVNVYDLCPECNSEFKKWIGEEEESLYPIADIYHDDFLSVFKIMVSGTSAADLKNSDFQSCAAKHLRYVPRVVSSKGDFFISEVVYSFKDNSIKLCAFNDQGSVNPLTLNDILTAIRYYPDNAVMKVCIDGGAK